MRLKMLEMQGFKSFPEKATFGFGKGICAIVGPNGSGKSNVADAVRWVLGEQSTRTLRGSKMEDVIFGGTETRKSVGFAEVSITIENDSGRLATEYNEVVITRRYYRSGESEFYINRSPVRLKDVHELFMDTGLGRDGYSIIGQGRIDEILSLKSEDRREIFEEAAGISKFRHRKEEAERKFNLTEENLVRIRDIIFELAQQVEPLREQSEKAKKYLKIYDELKQLEIDLWLHNLDKSRGDSEKFLNDFEIVTAQFERLQTSIGSLYTEIEELTEQLHGTDVLSEEKRNELHGLELSLTELKNTISILEANIQNNLENIRRIESEREENQNRAGGIKEQIAQREQIIGELKADEEALKLELNELSKIAEEEEQKAATMEARLDFLRLRELKINTRISELDIELSGKDAQTNLKVDRSGQIDEQIAEKTQQLKKAKDEASAIDDELFEANELKTSGDNIIKGLTLRQSVRQEKLNKLKEQQAQLQIKESSLSHKRENLIEMEKDLTGYSNAVKAIIKESEHGRLKGILGAVSSIIAVQREHAVAIEIALGNAMQNIVTEDEASAKAGISFLKASDIGRATFLPITTVRGGELGELGLKDQDGFVSIASSLVKADKKFREIIESLLGRTVICRDIDAASAIAKQYGYKFKIVTLDGQVINAGGSYTGGSVNRSSGVITRSNEIDRLGKELEKLSGEADRLAAELIEAQREVEAINYEINVTAEKHRSAEDSVLKLEGTRKQYGILISTLTEYIDNLTLEKERLTIDMTDIEKHNAELTRERADLSAELLSIQEETRKLDSDGVVFEAGKSELGTKIGDLKLRLAELSAKISENEKSKEELVSISDEMGESVESRKALIDSILLKNGELEIQITDQNNAVLNMEEQISALRGQVNDAAQEKSRLEALRNKKEKELKAQNDEVIRLERERSRLEIKKNAFQLEEEQLIGRLWENYELTVEDAETLRRPVQSVSQVSKRIAELKAQKKELGSVNIDAIEEYARVSERYEFLSGQRNDLEKAKDELSKIIANITEKMREIFTEQFAVINRNFSETFTEIFGGGRAELELSDPNDVLECGIEIKAQPPGKTLKTITLLSGGERAFVAIALYFAILKVRPTPFCVLDEIEAALDDVNVARFADYLCRLAEDTQFIVITHRRGTMERADTLYGITMQEKGVSKMLTINIGEIEEKLNVKFN